MPPKTKLRTDTSPEADAQARTLASYIDCWERLLRVYGVYSRAIMIDRDVLVRIEKSRSLIRQSRYRMETLQIKGL